MNFWKGGVVGILVPLEKAQHCFPKRGRGGQREFFSENSSKSDNPNVPNWTIGHESESRV